MKVFLIGNGQIAALRPILMAIADARIFTERKMAEAVSRFYDERKDALVPRARMQAILRRTCA